MRIKWNTVSLTNVRIEPGETVCIEFSPAGLNAPGGEEHVQIIVKAIALPGGRMALRFNLPEWHCYSQPGSSPTGFTILSDPNRPDEIVLPGMLKMTAVVPLKDRVG